MAASTQHVLEGIERRRIELQTNVNKLQKALSHWTTWEAEYEALKEELQHASGPSLEQMRDIARDLKGSLLNEKEFEDLLGKDLKTKRSANQVVDVISRRIDYVQQNSATVEKQLDTAEKQLAGVDVLLEPGLDNEEGLPMMDIEEELDDAGNEVSSSVNQTGKGAAEVVEALRKVGLKKAELGSEPAVHRKEDLCTRSATPDRSSPNSELIKSTFVPSGSTTSKPASHSSKSVSFAAGEPKKPKASGAKEALQEHGYDEDLDTLNFTTGTKVIQLDNNDDMVASYPVIPQGESPEDAELRRQMLQYGLSEVGKVVAELDLDRPTASYSGEDFDYDSDFNDYGTETDDDEEDEYGRTTKPVITEEYRRQMLELEKKLSARMLENVGPTPEEQPLAEHISDIRTMRVRKDDDFDQSLNLASPGSPQAATDEEPKKKRGVRFAESLDISEAPQPISKSLKGEQTVRPTISDTIVERVEPPSESTAQPPKPAKVSRFKSARAGPNAVPRILPMPAPVQAPAIPTGPAGQTLASTVNEHVPGPTEPQAPDEFDPALIHREVQAEYHKARNKFIQQQGGFKATEEDEESPIVEERDGKTKKVSRFMTARLKAEGM